MVELLVVSAILIVLAALLFVIAGRATAAAEKATCNNNLRQIGVGLGSFVAEHNRYPSDQRADDDDLHFDREILLQMETPHAEALADNTPLSVRRHPGFKDGVASLFICPTDRLERSSQAFKRSYAYVPWACNLTQFEEDIPRGFAHLAPNKGVAPSMVVSPSTSAVIVEWHAGTDTIENCLGHGSHQYHDRGGEATGRDPKQQCHRGTQNVLFCDGHVENVAVMGQREFTTKYWPLDTRFNPAQTGS